MKRKVFISLAVILVLLILTIITVTVTKRKFAYNPCEPFKGLTVEKLKKVEMVRGRDTLVLVREGGEWWVESHGRKFVADSSLVSKRFSNMFKARGRIASQNPEKFKVLGFDSSEVKYFLFEDEKGKEYGPYYLGKSGQDFMSQFIRIRDSKEILQVDAYLASYLLTNPESWRVRKLLRFPKERITKVVFRDTLGEVSVLKKDTLWIMPGADSMPESKKIENIVNTIGSLYASSFADTVSPDSCGFEKPWFTLTVVRDDGKECDITVGKLADKYRYYVKVSDRDEILLVGKGVLERIRKFFRRENNDRKAEKKNAKS